MPEPAEKFVRDMDRILIRVPDGMKERLEGRARANGRSVNTEIVSILSGVLNGSDTVSLQLLQEAANRVEIEMSRAEATIEELRHQREYIQRELANRQHEVEAEEKRRLVEKGLASE